ncbi:hypothetical protein [Ruegeria sp. PrR005]|uniref:Uncharacterized protein n=1 Tax=Ruegeria sp. PrR005 TaxID=2706882 RepID=A0A6B2NS34_9RHOB|nr:hypothetical protein [Ruegeria sp. PrR005]NDW45623.1 hypothetical protein [Ruegeria sp. PrR005]
MFWKMRMRGSSFGIDAINKKLEGSIFWVIFFSAMMLSFYQPAKLKHNYVQENTAVAVAADFLFELSERDSYEIYDTSSAIEMFLVPNQIRYVSSEYDAELNQIQRKIEAAISREFGEIRPIRFQVSVPGSEMLCTVLLLGRGQKEIALADLGGGTHKVFEFEVFRSLDCMFFLPLPVKVFIDEGNVVRGLAYPETVWNLIHKATSQNQWSHFAFADRWMNCEIFPQTCVMDRKHALQSYLPEEIVEFSPQYGYRYYDFRSDDILLIDSTHYGSMIRNMLRKSSSVELLKKYEEGQLSWAEFREKSKLWVKNDDGDARYQVLGLTFGAPMFIVLSSLAVAYFSLSAFYFSSLLLNNSFRSPSEPFLVMTSSGRKFDFLRLAFFIIFLASPVSFYLMFHDLVRMPISFLSRMMFVNPLDGVLTLEIFPTVNMNPVIIIPYALALFCYIVLLPSIFVSFFAFLNLSKFFWRKISFDIRG